MLVTLRYAAVVLAALCAPVYPQTQWEGGVPGASPKTIQVQVARPPAAPPAPATPPPFRFPPKPIVPVVPMVPRAPAAPRRPPASRPGSPPFFPGALTPAFFDEVWSDRPCGMSRPGTGGATNFWALDMLGTMRFTCSCRMGDNFEMNKVDNSPTARQHCMTAATGVFCCIA